MGQRISIFRQLTAAALLAALAGATAQAGDLAAVQERGQLVMLCFAKLDSNYVRPRLDVMRQEGLALTALHRPDHFEGLDVELIRGFAERLGVGLEIRSVTSSYGELIPALLAGRGDLVASSITITERRREMADFSAPYVSSHIVAAVPWDSPIATAADLAGKKVAVMEGSSQLEYIRKHGPPDLELEVHGYTLENYLAVTEGDADFMLMDSAAAPGETVDPEYPKLKVAFRLQEEGYGVAFRPGSDLLAPFDAYLAELVSSGRLAALKEQYLSE